jgi:hypothetical protein
MNSGRAVVTIRYVVAMMAVLAQALGAVLLVAAVAVWSWPVALGVAGVLLILAGALAEASRSPGGTS